MGTSCFSVSSPLLQGMSSFRITPMWFASSTPSELQRDAGTTTLYCTVLYCTVLYYTVLYYTIQYNTIQYSTVQYSTVQYRGSNTLSPCLLSYSPSDINWLHPPSQSETQQTAITIFKGIFRKL